MHAQTMGRTSDGAFGAVSRISELRSLGIEPDTHESVIVGYLAESERKNLESLLWFAQSRPNVFCARKSAVITYAVLDRLTAEEFLEYVRFLKDFVPGYHSNKRTAWSIIRLLSVRKGISVEVPAEFANPQSVPVANPVFSPELAQVVRSASESAERTVAWRIGISEKRLSEAYYKRLWRRYSYLRSEYVVRWSGERFDERELSKELFWFMQAHIAGNRAAMALPRFEDMGASVDDSSEGLSLYFLLLRKYADAGYPLSGLRRWLEQKRSERFDAEGLAYVRFFLRTVDDADERKGVENRKVRDAREELQYLRSVLARTVSRIDEIVASLSPEDD